MPALRVPACASNRKIVGSLGVWAASPVSGSGEQWNSKPTFRDFGSCRVPPGFVCPSSRNGDSLQCPQPNAPASAAGYATRDIWPSAVGHSCRVKVSNLVETG